MNSVMIDDDEVKIEDLIYEIRGKQVMIDSDLARLYHCKNGTKDINKTVKRNIERFPNNFMFQLTDKEYNCLRFQIGTSNERGGRRYNPYVFTEQGVAMLSSVLHTELAIDMSIRIMNAFVSMRHYIGEGLIEQKFINNLVLVNNEDIKNIKKDVKLLQESFNKFEEKRKINDIYFNGQIFDAYYKIYEIFKSANSKLIIIDGYAESTILNIIKKLDIDVIIITKSNNLLSKQDIDKYNLQYHNLSVVYDNTFHDRYFILDDNIIYHCGASINRIGYKTFSITLIGDRNVCNVLIENVKKII